MRFRVDCLIHGLRDGAIDWLPRRSVSMGRRYEREEGGVFEKVQSARRKCFEEESCRDVLRDDEIEASKERKRKREKNDALDGSCNEQRKGDG